MPGHEALNAALIEECARLRAVSPGVDKSNRLGWPSSGKLFDETTEPIALLRSAVEGAVRDATTRIKSKTDPSALHLKLFAWMNSNPAGGFNAPHTHPGAHWSGAYYVSQPAVDNSNSGMIEFLDPRTDLANSRRAGVPRKGEASTFTRRDDPVSVLPSAPGLAQRSWRRAHIDRVQRDLPQKAVPVVGPAGLAFLQVPDKDSLS